MRDPRRRAGRSRASIARFCVLDGGDQKGKDILTVGNLGRHVPAEVRLAHHGEWPRVRHLGCNLRGISNVDHTHDYAKGGPTAFEAAPLCSRAHQAKSRAAARRPRPRDPKTWLRPPPGVPGLTLRSGRAPTRSRPCRRGCGRSRVRGTARAGACTRRAWCGSAAGGSRGRAASSPSAAATIATTCWPHLGSGRPDHDRIGHRVVRLQRGLDLLGVHLLAAGVDAHRAAPEEMHGAVGVDRRHVAGQRPAGAVDLARTCAALRSGSL